MIIDTSIKNKAKIKSFNKLLEYSKTTNYDYSKVIFKSQQDKIIIICKIHGEFETKPYVHIKGSLCPKCANLKRGNNQRLFKNLNEFKNISFNKYGKYFNYDYIDEEELLNNNKIEIICPIHGIMLQTGISHLKKKTGCQKCSAFIRAENICNTTESFIQKSKKIFGDLYDYSQVNIVRGDKYTTIGCPNHGFIKQLIVTHQNGHGCLKCKNDRDKIKLYKDRKTILYYIKIGSIFKIGITMKNSVKDRFKYDKMIPYFDIIFETSFEDGSLAYLKEQEIIRKYEEFKYVGRDIVESGNTELFTKNVLKVWKS